jgi:hypothetical protein
MKETKHKCDNCDRDLSDSKQVPRYRLYLGCTNIPSSSSVICAVMVYPPLDREHHFCDFDCLTKWVNKGKHEQPS